MLPLEASAVQIHIAAEDSRLHAEHRAPTPSTAHPATGGEKSAIVTFYSHGSWWTLDSPGGKHDIYMGAVFDGRERLFSFMDGRWSYRNDRYITLRLAPGSHTFGAINGKAPVESETLRVNLSAGRNYFIRVQGETEGAFFVVQHGKLELVPCADARKELRKAKQLRDKAISEEMSPQKDTLVVKELEPPSCQH